MFERPIERWELAPDGAPIVTHSSRLLPVRRRRDGSAAILKVAVVPEERSGGRLMPWWGGDGAARVLAREGAALLLERAEGGRLLAAMSRDGRDDEATRIVCGSIARLHARRCGPPPPLVPLARWFEALWPAAALHGGILASCAAAARELLAAPPATASVLHGDVHHGNILDFGEARGWLAIDPKGLRGERGFDYANLFRNPDRGTATAPGRLARRAAIVAEAAGIDRERLVLWVLAYAGLSAAWSLEDGVAPATELAIAELASRELTALPGRGRTARQRSSSPAAPGSSAQR